MGVGLEAEMITEIEAGVELETGARMEARMGLERDAE